MIISMDQVQVVVLNPDNTESTYSYKQLRGKIQKKFLNNLVYDNQQERLHIDDQVSIDDGPFKGNSGVVRCLWKNFIYVYCSNIITHSHMVVCKSREVSIIGIHHDNSEVVIQTRQKQSNDIGRYVTILHGVNKGLRGTIRSTTSIGFSLCPRNGIYRWYSHSSADGKKVLCYTEEGRYSLLWRWYFLCFLSLCL